MKYYGVAEIDVTDPTWVPGYVNEVTKLIEERGGRYLARTSNVDKLEGDRQRPQLMVIVEFPSKEAAQAFYESDAYRPYRHSRLQRAHNELVLVAGEDITKRHTYPIRGLACFGSAKIGPRGTICHEATIARTRTRADKHSRWPKLTYAALS